MARLTQSATAPASLRAPLSRFNEAAEALAHAMADANDVEGAWFLRGVIDALVWRSDLDSMNGHEYEAQYRRGFDSATA